MPQVLTMTTPPGSGLTTVAGGNTLQLGTAHGAPPQQIVILTQDAASGSAEQDTATIGIPDIINYIRKRWKLGLIFALPLAALTFWGLGMGKKVFEAESRILLRLQDPNVFNFSEMAKPNVTELSAPMLVNNHRSEMKSRRYADYLYDHVGDEDRDAFLKDGVKGPSLYDKVKGWIFPAAPVVPNPKEIFARKLDLATRVEPLKDSHILRVQVRCGDAGLSARLANHYVEDYTHYVAEQETKITQTEYEYLQKKAEELHTQLEQSEQELQRYRQSQGLVQDSETKDVAAERIRLLTNSISDAQVRLTKAKQDLANVQNASAARRDLLDLRLIAENPDVAATRKLLEQKLAESAPLETWAGPRHPKRVAIAQEIQTYREALQRNIDAVVTMVGTEVETIAKQITDLQSQLDAAQREVLAQGGKNIDQKLLLDKVAANRDLYTKIVQRMRQAEVTGQFMDSGLLRVSDTAAVPIKPVKPNKPIALVASMFIFGLFLFGVPVGSGFYAEQIVPKLRKKTGTGNPEDSGSSGAAAPAPEPEATAPKMPALPQNAVASGSIVAALGEVPNATPTNLLAEFVRPGSTSANSLHELIGGLEKRAKQREGPGVLLIASAEPGEGKTSLASALAAGFCNHGRRVFMIEANAESPTFHLLFPHAYTHATWTSDGMESLRYGTSNLYLLPSHDTTPGDMPDLLENYRGWIEKARPQVDWIILDGSSVMRNFTEVAPLLPLATEVLLVQDQTRGGKSKATAALNLLRPRLPEETFLGVVANRTR